MVERIRSFFNTFYTQDIGGRRKRSLGGVVANVLNCDIVVSEFKLQSHYYSHFWTNALGEKVWTPLYPHQLRLLSF